MRPRTFYIMIYLDPSEHEALVLRDFKLKFAVTRFLVRILGSLGHGATSGARGRLPNLA